jgi:predicted O-methyltransferase YrrM
MSQDLWTSVDQYVSDSVVREDAALSAAAQATLDAGLPNISVTPAQGKLLFILARVQRASRVLEIGTLAAYSTIWLARAVGPDGRVITLESDARHADVARGNLARAGLDAVVDVRVGKALETLPGVLPDGPFDLIFIDADKPSVPEYFQWALRLSKPGSLIIVDNVVREGALIDKETTDASAVGVRRLHDMLGTESRVSATTIQTVGAKGHDGFLIALVNEL